MKKVDLNQFSPKELASLELQMKERKEAEALRIQQERETYKSLKDEAIVTLKYFPQCMPALFIKFNTLQYLGKQYIEKYGQTPSDYIDNNYKEYKATKYLIENLGYRELSAENYEQWLQSMDKELDKQKTKE